MDLRDYLAGQAAAGAALFPRLNDGNAATRMQETARIARTAYEIADAMLLARVAHDEQPSELPDDEVKPQTLLARAARKRLESVMGKAQ